MLRAWTTLLAAVLCATAAERTFDFSQTKLGETPKGFRSAVSGEGQPGQWKIITDTAPASLPSLSTNAPAPNQYPVLAQVARDPADEHFPVLIFEEETYGDFTFTARLKTVAGNTDQMAGLAFRVQDEKNYYVVRISTSGQNVRFYKFVGGIRGLPIGPELPVPRGVWHELSVQCKGNLIKVFFNGKLVMPELTDPSFTKGKIGFWTKSDSVSHFADARLVYTPQERLAAALVREALAKYDKLRGLKLYAIAPAQSEPRVIASGQAAEVGQPGGPEEKTCLLQGTPYFGKGPETVAVLLPLRDRNGEVAAAARITMNTFFGQTQDNALVRARPVLKLMEQRLVAANEPL
jgi:hypothetical protein